MGVLNKICDARRFFGQGYFCGSNKMYFLLPVLSTGSLISNYLLIGGSKLIASACVVLPICSFVLGSVIPYECHKLFLDLLFVFLLSGYFGPLWCMSMKVGGFFGFIMCAYILCGILEVLCQVCPEPIYSYMSIRIDSDNEHGVRLMCFMRSMCALLACVYFIVASAFACV